MKMKKTLLILSTTAMLLACLLPASVFANTDNISVQKERFNTHAKVLKDRGIDESIIAELNDDLYPLVNEITNSGLSKTQIDNYIDGIKKAKEQNRKVEENRKKGIIDESVQITREVIDGMVTLPDGHKIPVPQNDKHKNNSKTKASSEVTASAVTLGHGPYYNVDAKVGYNQITSMVDLPQVKSTTPSGIIPYVLGGAYVTTDNINYDGGADVGAFSEVPSGGGAPVWRLAINGRKCNGCQVYWTSSTATLPNTTVYLNYKVAADNQLQIIASDVNYNYIASISYFFPDIYLHADGSNVEMATGFSMAYKNVSSISDGSYSLNGHFYNTYVYKPSGYSLMNSSTVAHASKKGTSDELTKISVNTVSPYYNYYVNIDFR